LNAAYTLRLSFPVALNFMDSIRVHDTAFAHVISHAAVIPLFGSAFSTFFPIVVIFFAVATYFHAFGKCLQILRLIRADVENSRFSELDIEEGKSLIRRVRRRRQKREEDQSSFHSPSSPFANREVQEIEL